MTTALFSVVYPGIDVYLSDFFDSLSRQTDKDFTIFIINDGLPNIERFIRPGLMVKIKNVQGELPASIRKIGIQWMIDAGVEYIIFGDADDYFENNRIELSKHLLKNHDLICNELILIGDHIKDPIKMLEPHFNEGEKISEYQIKFANCMGMSNTALKTNNLNHQYDRIPGNTVAFDWALFALYLHSGADCIFTKTTATYYRQHEKNVASPLSLDEQQIMTGVQVKLNHYTLLSYFYQEYVSLADSFKELYTKLQSDRSLMQKYCFAVRDQAPVSPLWWEPIKTIKDVML